MTLSFKTPEEYIEQIPTEKRDAFEKLRKVILENLPKGFSETVSYGMIGYVVPFSLYPNGYQSNPKQPLPYINIASQKKLLRIAPSGFICRYNAPGLVLSMNIRNSVRQSRIWVKAVSGSKIRIKFLMSLLES